MNRARVPERFMRLSAVLVVLLSLPVLGSAQTGQSPEALAKALQARYQSVRDFTADFVQIYRGGVLRTETRESGTVAVKKPGRMRDDRHERVPHRLHVALCQLRTVIACGIVQRCQDDIEAGECLVVEVESAVGHDLHLDAVQNLDAGDLRSNGPDFLTLQRNLH